MAHVVVKLRDTQTGDQGVYEHETEPDADGTFDGTEFLWTDGNFACDCNRLLFIARALGRPDPDVTCGDSRVEIIEATIDGANQNWS